MTIISTYRLKSHNKRILDIISTKIKDSTTEKLEVFVTNIKTKEEFIGIFTPTISFFIYPFTKLNLVDEDNIKLGYLIGNDKLDQVIPLLVQDLHMKHFRLHFRKGQPFEEAPGCYS